LIVAGMIGASLCVAAPVFAASTFAASARPLGVSADANSIPDFSGVWGRDFSGGRMSGIANLSPRDDVVIGDYKSPVLQPWASAIVKKHGDMERAGLAAPETKTTCWPGGVPNMLSIPSSMELLQTPDQVTLLYSNDHQVRFIYLNRPHSPQVTPSWYGESVGHYEGDILVVDTIGLAAKPMSMIDVFGTPHTEALHVVERFHKINGGGKLKVDITVEDPGTFTKTFTEFSTFTKANYAFEEYVCPENNPLIGIGSEVGQMPHAKYVAPF
jgi:hypothetical protein